MDGVYKEEDIIILKRIEKDLTDLFLRTEVKSIDYPVFYNLVLKVRGLLYNCK